MTCNLPEPVTQPDGTVLTQGRVLARDPEGFPMYRQSRSTLFFIPARVRWIVDGVVEVVLLIVATFQWIA